MVQLFHDHIPPLHFDLRNKSRLVFVSPTSLLIAYFGENRCLNQITIDHKVLLSKENDHN